MERVWELATMHNLSANDLHNSNLNVHVDNDKKLSTTHIPDFLVSFAFCLQSIDTTIHFTEL